MVRLKILPLAYEGTRLGEVGEGVMSTLRDSGIEFIDDYQVLPYILLSEFSDMEYGFLSKDKDVPDGVLFPLSTYECWFDHMDLLDYLTLKSQEKGEPLLGITSICSGIIMPTNKKGFVAVRRGLSAGCAESPLVAFVSSDESEEVDSDGHVDKLVEMASRALGFAHIAEDGISDTFYIPNLHTDPKGDGNLRAFWF